MIGTDVPYPLPRQEGSTEWTAKNFCWVEESWNFPLLLFWCSLLPFGLVSFSILLANILQYLPKHLYLKKDIWEVNFLRRCLSLLYTHTSLIVWLEIEPKSFSREFWSHHPNVFYFPLFFKKSSDNMLLDLCKTCFFSLKTMVIFFASLVFCNSLVLSLSLCLFKF